MYSFHYFHDIHRLSIPTYRGVEFITIKPNTRMPTLRNEADQWNMEP